VGRLGPSAGCVGGSWLSHTQQNAEPIGFGGAFPVEHGNGSTVLNFAWRIHAVFLHGSAVAASTITRTMYTNRRRIR
jgi:hypothetical protein